MSVKYKATKLDGRYAGYRYFSHYITVAFPKSYNQQSSVIEFNKIRDWCIRTWGPSCELYDYEYLKYMKTLDTDYAINQYWSWYVKDSVHRLYVTPKAKVWFDLTWM